MQRWAAAQQIHGLGQFRLKSGIDTRKSAHRLRLYISGSVGLAEQAETESIEIAGNASVCARKSEADGSVAQSPTIAQDRSIDPHSVRI